MEFAAAFPILLPEDVLILIVAFSDRRCELCEGSPPTGKSGFPYCLYCLDCGIVLAETLRESEKTEMQFSYDCQNFQRIRGEYYNPSEEGVECNSNVSSDDLLSIGQASDDVE